MITCLRSLYPKVARQLLSDLSCDADGIEAKTEFKARKCCLSALMVLLFMEVTMVKESGC